MEWVFKAIVFCLTAGLFAVVLERTVPEFALLVGVLTAVLVLILSARFLEAVFQFLEELKSVCGLSGVYTQPILKCLALALMTKIGTSLCRDSKQSGAAAALEFLGAAAALWICIPLLEAFLSMLEEIL